MPTPTTNRRFLQSVCLGVLAGLMHLTRADGILWLTVGFFSILLNITSEKNKGVMESIQRLIMFSVPFLAAYLLVMAPWYYRNFILFQSPGVNGSLRALFLTEYNELYQYPAGSITFSRWLESGFAAILHDRVRAAGLNFLSFLGVQNLVFLLPFTMVGLWNRRKEKITKIVLFSWSSIFLVMSVVFPYAGSRGGFFHSASAVQIWLFLYSMAGFKDLLRILKEKRNWDSTQAKRILGTGFTIIFGVLSFILFINQLGGNPAIDVSGWRDYDEQFRVVESKLDNLGVSKSDVIMVNDPPGYHAATERPCLAIPNGDESVLAKAMEDYHVEYLVLQQNHPEGLRAMYTEQESEYFNILVRGEGYSIWVISKDSQ
ncbi:MAG: hypothetical protein HPY85_04750 [Anaerolineae bacterium]|nr:hypothetical protein [Anaerolineae bacterium]